MKIDADLLADCKTLAFSVAPELKTRPLYLVDLDIFDGLAGVLRHNLHAWAYPGCPVDFDYRERIGASWRGPGPIVAFDTATITDSCLPNAFADAVRCILLHELGHLLPPPVEFPTIDLGERFDSPAMRAWHEAKRVRSIALPTPEPGSAGDFHNAEFVRIVCHLIGRAQLLGWQIRSFQLFGGDLTFLPEPPLPVLMLMREIVELRHAPFSEIVTVSPPEAFTALWESCLKFHQSLLSIQESEQ